MRDRHYPLPPTVEFVITAPEPYGAELAVRTRARMTLGVLTQLIAQADHYLIIAAPFIQRGARLYSETLGTALKAALHRGVNVDVVSTGSGLQALDVTSLWGVTRGHIRLFQPKANVLDERELGFHAKFCLADGLHAYIGSANLTGGGLYGNLEMGLLVHGELVQQVEQFWRYLLEIGFLIQVDM